MVDRPAYPGSVAAMRSWAEYRDARSALKLAPSLSLSPSHVTIRLFPMLV